MAKVRQLVMWLVLAAIALLAVLAVAGAFLDAQPAKALFNSAPVAVFWFVLAGLLAAGFVFFGRLIRSPGALGMHAGSLLVLVGAMWGSDAAHDLRRAWFGSDKVSAGFMVIGKGQVEDRVLDPRTMQPVGELPFGLRLRDFWIEYYPAKERPWALVGLTPVLDAAGRVVDERQTEIPWTLGQEVAIPETRARVTVLQYLESAAAAFAEGAEPVVEIAAADGSTVRLPARPGQEVDLKDPALKVRVRRVFINPVLEGSGDDRRLADAPDAGLNPAAEVELTRPDGSTDLRLLMALVPMHGRRDDGPDMRYVFPEAIGARPDPTTGVPAMEVLLKAGGREQRQWFMPRRHERYAGLALAPLLAQDPEHPQPADEAGLFLVAPRTPISDYLSDLGVLADGKQVAAKVIEVNDPLHWGGYHFYQADYDHQHEQYTVLKVVSDSGLLAVWVGLTLLVAGACSRLWVEPAWRHSRRHKVGLEST